MRVIIKEPGKLGYAKDIPNTLEALQAEVGGYIEVVHINGLLVAVINEEGRLMNLKENICGLVGTVVLCGESGEEFTDIDPQQAQLLLDGYNPLMAVRDAKTGGVAYVL